MLPLTAFAAEDNTLGGTLKVTGEAKEGGTLKADLSKVTPAGIEAKNLDFKWFVKAGKAEGKEDKSVGAESSLKVTKEMVGSSVYLVVSPKEDSGIAGDKLTSEAVTVKDGTAQPTETPAPTETPTPEPTPEAMTEEPLEEEPPAEEVPEPEPLKEIALPVITTETLPDVTQETEYQVQLEAQSEDAVTWAVKDGEGILPEGLNLSADGVLEGQTKVDAGAYSFTVTASNSGGTTEKAFTLNVVAKTVYAMTAEPEALDFGELKEGYKDVEGKKVTLTNTGNQDLTFKEMTAASFEISATEGDLKAGDRLHLTVVPKTGLTKGDYEEKLTFITEEGTQAEVTAKAKVVSEITPVYEMTISPDSYDFGTAETGYEKAPEAVQIEITNTGNQDLVLEQPESKNYSVSKLTASKLAPKEKATFTVRPKKDLPMGNYDESIDITSEDVAGETLNVKFEVTGNKLISIVDPAAITGLKNAVEKSSKALGLPESVKIKTGAGEKSAHVDWDVKSASYDPTSVDAQSFTIKGKVTLPDGVSNPDGISLTAQIRVEVKAYVPRIPDTSELKINNLSSNTSYKTNTSISFSATGAGNNSSPRKGDVRYIPYAWKLGSNSYTAFADSNYSAVLKAANAGTYTLSVSYERDVYDGSTWKADGTMAYKEMSLKFIKDTVTITPAAKNSNTTKKNAVETGDQTNIGGWIITIVIAIVIIGAAGFLVYKKRRH